MTSVAVQPRSRSTSEGFGAGARSVLACVVLALRHVRKLALSQPERQLMRLVEYAASTIGRRALDARSVDDLDDRLDALLEEPALLHVNGLLVEAVTADLLEAAPSTRRLADLAEDVFGAGQRPLLEEGERLWQAVGDATAPLLAAMTVEERRDLSRSFAAEAPSTLWTNRETPAQVARALVGALRSGVCMLAMVQALLEERKLEPWLSRALLERWVDGARRYLIFLASTPGVSVSEELVSVDQRLDLEALARALADTTTRTEALLEEARQRGAAVHPPHAERGDE